MLRASAQRDAAGSGAFPSPVLSKQLCAQGLRVAQAHAGLIVAVHSSVRERLEQLFHFGRHGEIVHSTRECWRSPLVDAQSYPEEPVDDPYLLE